VVYTGFVAQEVEEAAKALNYDFSGVDKPKNKEDFYGLRYGDFVVPLVKAVQELSKKNEELEARIARLEAALTRSTNGSNNTLATVSGAYLKQNVPNPHNGNTLIQYSLPQGTSSAQIIITNSKGQILKTIALNSRGEGQVSLQTGSLPAGTYTYSLWTEGRQADAKQMVIVK
jgi:phage gp37-like protein